MSYPTYIPYGSTQQPAFAPQSRPAAFQPQGYPVPANFSAVQPAPGFGQGGGFSVQPVTTKEEALAVIADPFLAGVLMPDMAHGMIYLKRFNTQTGASDFIEFRAAAEPALAPEPQYVSVEMFEKTVENLRSEFLSAKRGKGVRNDAADE